MLKTHITIIGTHGRNASRYLKEHLAQKGVRAHAVGMHFKNPATKQRIKNAKTIICINADVKKAVEEVFDTSKKLMICLDVSDVPEGIESSRALTGELWLEHQETHVYPTLEKQIKRHMKKLVVVGA